MIFSLTTLFCSAIAYLLVLFLIAYATENRWVPRTLVRHPAVYVLSLGVYATTWSYYGSVGFADRMGIGFVSIYVGVGIAFALTPVLLMPLLRLTRSHQLTSVADVFAFRYDSQLAGVLVTLMMLTGSLPYIALQIRAVAESTQVLSGESSPGPTAIGFCLLVTVFAIIFGARHVTARDKHIGLVAAIAFESVIKIGALLLVAATAIGLAFGSPLGMERWLTANPEQLEAFYAPITEGLWPSLVFLAFAAAFLLPRQFHMTFVENLQPRSLLTASWAFPLLLLILSVAIPPILWAGYALRPGVAPDYFVLGIAMASQSAPLALLAYIGGISAASAMIIVGTLALSSMTLNHLVLPCIRLDARRNIYGALRWARRLLIAAIIGAGYLFYSILERSEGLVAWGLISFVAMTQFLPGIVGVLFWPRATRAGLIAGLLAGGSVWGATVMLPALTSLGPIEIAGIELVQTQGTAHYAAVTFWAVSINALTFALVSLISQPGPRELEAAAACRDTGTRLPRGALLAADPRQFVAQLRALTGTEFAEAEVGKALADLQLDWQESRPDRLQQLREQIERNLSGMMGPVLARLIVDERLRLDAGARAALSQDVRLIEERLERSTSRFQGLAAELDQLRRYHRQILEDLPLGVVAVTSRNRIVRWNPAIQHMTGILAAGAVGRQIRDLKPPWGALLGGFLEEPTDHAPKRALQLAGETRSLSLHKAAIAEPGRSDSGDRLLLVEDVSELQRLEDELTHSERLASIGRLAAGVAHEIGNPVTGIACLAQELRDTSAGALAEPAEQILGQTRRIDAIVQTLVSYAHAGSPEAHRHAPTVLAKAVEEAVRVVRLSKRGRSMRFEHTVAAGLIVIGDSQRLVQVFVNLLTNASDACDGHGSVRIRATPKHDSAHIRVVDDGPGLTPGSEDKIVEPFFTTKQPGEGTGLGLALVYNIVAELGGELRVRNRRDGHRGTEVVFALPSVAEARAEDRA